MLFDALTGKTANHVPSDGSGLWLGAITKEEADEAGCNAWYPCFDWCGRYTGSVLRGQFTDAENPRKEYHGRVI
jgi:hypothetical protein